ncbi:hypothetical protein LWC34_10975 [Kibdelosporangium philippinense]|uniref:Uncharacterized protein n=1 Tax=Kibdelosporangium philippinense TaxID=211113 RepID=A0ABS8Z656_9PSEU|nr:hypothetical protein [Kibdelosporangium philippinense]MCE7003345.1 hypothetical protein [Kibdelosporangium philippinense]
MAGPIDTQAGRAELLAAIAPDTAERQHALIRQIFHAEFEARSKAWSVDSDFDGDYFENLYWSAFLLYLVGDPSDVPMMWRAKHIDFDTGCGFDVQNMLGAGAAATLAYLTEHGHDDIAEALSRYPELHDDPQDWEEARREYFWTTG